MYDYKKRNCIYCDKQLNTNDKRIYLCSDECREKYYKEYQKSIPSELKLIYQRKYYNTERGKQIKSEKNRRYRERQKLSLLLH